MQATAGFKNPGPLPQGINFIERQVKNAIADNNISEIIRLAHDNGASYIIPAFGRTLRDRQRAYYYDKLARHFPGRRQRYIEAFGNDYFAPVRNYNQLENHFKAVCKRYGIPTRMPQYQPFSAEQLSLF